MIRGAAKQGLRLTTKLKRYSVVSYMQPEMKLSSQDQTLPRWAQFFISQLPNIEFDIDRTLLNAQQDEADDYAVRYILGNFQNLKSYQLLRALMFINSFVSRSKIVSELRKRIVEGDLEIFKGDVEVLARLNLIFFYDDPLLIEFSVYNIARHFTSQDLIGRVYSMSYLLLISKMPEGCLEAYLKDLAEIESGTADSFQKDFDSWRLDLKLTFLYGLQALEVVLKRDADRMMVKTLMTRYFAQIFASLRVPGNLKKLLNHDPNSLKMIKDMFFISYGETRHNFVLMIRDLLDLVNETTDAETVIVKRDSYRYFWSPLLISLTPAEIEMIRKHASVIMQSFFNGRTMFLTFKFFINYECINKRGYDDMLFHSHRASTRALPAVISQGSALWKTSSLHFLNVRDSFLPGEESRWTWEQTKIQVYRLFFHRMVSLETKKTLEEVLQMLEKDPEGTEYSMTLSLFKLYSPEMVSYDIAGYKNSFTLAMAQDSDKEELYRLQKLFDRDHKSFEDEEERIAKLFLGDEGSKKNPATDEKPESEEEETDEAKNIMQAAIDREQKESDRMARKLKGVNQKSFNLIDLFRNKTVVVLRTKLALIENYIDLCSMIITNVPDSIPRANLGPISTFLSAPEVSKLVNLIGSNQRWIDKLCGVHLQDNTLILNPILKNILESTMAQLNETLNGKSKQDIIKLYEQIAAEVPEDKTFESNLDLFKTYFPTKQEKNDAANSSLLRQIEFAPTQERLKILDSKNQVSRYVLLKEVLPRNMLFLRMMNPSVFLTSIEHQLRNEGILYKKNFWVYPYMADFVLPNGVAGTQKEGKEQTPVAIFVADSSSIVVGMPQTPRYLISQSKAYFKSKGYLVVTVQPEHLKLKPSPQFLTDLIVSISQTTININ